MLSAAECTSLAENNWDCCRCQVRACCGMRARPECKQGSCSQWHPAAHCVALSFAGSYDSGGECGVVTQKRFQMPLAPGPQMVRGEAVLCTKLPHIPTHTHVGPRTQNLAHVLTAAVGAIGLRQLGFSYRTHCGPASDHQAATWNVMEHLAHSRGPISNRHGTRTTTAPYTSRFTSEPLTPVSARHGIYCLLGSCTYPVLQADPPCFHTICTAYSSVLFAEHFMVSVHVLGRLTAVYSSHMSL